MNKVIALVAKFSGFNKVWDWADGKKTYGAATLAILTSVLGIATKLAPILSAHDTAALIGFIQQLPTDPSWLSLVGAIGLFGIGHKIEKSAQKDIPLPNA